MELKVVSVFVEGHDLLLRYNVDVVIQYSLDMSDSLTAIISFDVTVKRNL
jgi:hypothetical protein